MSVKHNIIQQLTNKNMDDEKYPQNSVNKDAMARNIFALSRIVWVIIYLVSVSVRNQAIIKSAQSPPARLTL